MRIKFNFGSVLCEFKVQGTVIFIDSKRELHFQQLYEDGDLIIFLYMAGGYLQLVELPYVDAYKTKVKLLDSTDAEIESILENNINVPDINKIKDIIKVTNYILTLRRCSNFEIKR